MRRLYLSPEARQDLIDIWDYIAPNNLDAADRLLDRIQTHIANLVEMPGMGHVRADVKDRRYRFWTVKPYAVAYLFDAHTLTVVRVVHGARDFRRVFRRSR